MNCRYAMPGFTALIFSACNVIVQAQEISVNKLDIPQLTSTGWITGFTQDSSGYMWFSSAGGGVFRYDGYTITDLKNQPTNPNSISSDRVECVAAGKNGVIWFGNFASGVDRFDSEKGRFKNFRNEINNKSSLINDTITALLVDHEGNLWIGTANGLDRYDEKEDRFIHYPHDEKNPSSISHNVVRTLYEDRNGVLWVGTGTPFDNGRITKQGGLNKFDKQTGRFTRYMHDDNDPTTLADNRVRAIFEDSRGILWVGTAGDGLHTMDREKGKFERHFYDPKFPEKLSRPALTQRFDWADDHITFINEDVTGAIVIGTFGAGLSRYDPQTKKIERYNNFSDSAANNRLCWWTFKSRDNILWLSTWLGGVYKLNPLSKKFFFQSFDQRVFNVSQLSPGIFWFSGPNGLIHENQKINKREIYKCDTLRTVANDRMIMLALAPDKAGNVWIGTVDGNIFQFEKDAKRFKDYNRDKSLQESDRHIFSLCVDKNDNLWIGSETGLEYLDTKSGHLTYYNGNNKQASPRHIFNVIEDRNGNIWTASFLEGGVNLLNKQTGQFENYLGNKGITSRLFEDEKGDIWAGTNEGLYRKEWGRQEFILFPNLELSQCLVGGIIEDYRKNLWVITTIGFFKIDPGRNRVSRFGKIHGFNEDQVGENIFLGIGANGKDILGFLDQGHFSVNPDDLIADATPPQVHIYGFSITNTNSKQGTGRNVSGYTLDVEKKIILNYNENSFSFEITPIHFSSPTDNKAEYMLNNYDPEWRVSEVGQKAYYFNIPAGKYTLKIRAYNLNGVMSEKDIVIIINPPWWRTWWAYTLYAAIFILASFIVNRIIRNRILEKERSKNREKELEHAKEIEKAYHELKLTQAQLIQSEKMASLGELTAGIAHEIQNPLNFVNNFSEVNTELLAEMNDEIGKGNYDEVKTIAKNVTDNHQKINLHGKRADSIVKGMLQHSRSSSGVKEPTNINALADEYLRIAYHGLRAKDKSFNATMKTDFDASIGRINIIPQDFGRVLVNLINNAFYAVKEKAKQNMAGYEPTVLVSTKKLNDKVEVRVIDNGNGIPHNVLDKIFQPFFTTKSTGQGTGLGLSLAYDIVKAHGGEIKVETKQGEGSEFLIRLPLS